MVGSDLGVRVTLTGTGHRYRCGGGRQRDSVTFACACPLSQTCVTPHLACCMACPCPCWRCSARYVVQTAAQPCLFSRAKSVCHESSLGCGLRAQPRWLLLGLAVHSPCSRCAPLFLASNKDVGFVNLSAVFLWCLVGVCRPARCVSSCRRVSQFVCDDGWFGAVGVRSAVAVSNVLPTQRPLRCPLVLRVAVVA